MREPAGPTPWTLRAEAVAHRTRRSTSESSEAAAVKSRKPLGTEPGHLPRPGPVNLPSFNIPLRSVSESVAGCGDEATAEKVGTPTRSDREPPYHPGTGHRHTHLLLQLSIRSCGPDPEVSAGPQLLPRNFLVPSSPKTQVEDESSAGQVCLWEFLG